MSTVRIYIQRVLFIVLLLIFALLFTAQRIETEGGLNVYFLDIGQGDAIYIRTPAGHDMLIDGGPSSVVLRRLAEVMPFYDKSIDVVIETHPDADHIGGLPSVFERYEVGRFIEPGIESKNAIDDEIRRLLKVEGISSELGRRGTRINFGDGSYFDILHPIGDVSNLKDTNSASIVGKLSYGSTSVMLTGDAPKSTEDQLVRLDGEKLYSTILKAGHHGSKTSSGEEFVRLVDPEYAIISSGKNNRYHHPNSETLETFRTLHIPYINTAQVGTIHFESDGVVFKRK